MAKSKKPAQRCQWKNCTRVARDDGYCAHPGHAGKQRKDEAARPSQDLNSERAADAAAMADSAITR